MIIRSAGITMRTIMPGMPKRSVGFTRCQKEGGTDLGASSVLGPAR